AMKCREKIWSALNERDRTIALSFYYPERPTFPTFAPAWQRPALSVANMRPRFPIKSARLRDVARLVCNGPCAATSKRCEFKDAGGSCHLKRLKREATQRSQSLQIVCAATLEKIEPHRPQLAAALIFQRS